VVPLQVFLALMLRQASWQLQEPSEKWSFFPIPAPEKGLPLSVQAL
jgi:hypothetical protein